jgi:hypothetical protein
LEEVQISLIWITLRSTFRYTEADDFCRPWYLPGKRFRPALVTIVTNRQAKKIDFKVTSLLSGQTYFTSGGKDTPNGIFSYEDLKAPYRNKRCTSSLIDRYCCVSRG